jgi:hypothetical protein
VAFVHDLGAAGARLGVGPRGTIITDAGRDTGRVGDEQTDFRKDVWAGTTNSA